ncbi:uncharacterized protein LOC123305786 [Chrysoperla carnea]|uniref:uncharacterized protein LOC123305786 n=1 Tax=Chrysoperla carnea TaxID=189513 RepID=UPI001D063F40|nr:uncharacterized protein LOC123305786 [Chrysoperla carnea]XP_044743547.1 uncharacterized protein LOC123305786 [Chrysoperla carnea]
MAILLNTINMATQFQSGSEFHLITTNEIQENDYREIERSRRKFLIIFKTAQVILLLISLTLLIIGSHLVEKTIYANITFIVHGAFLMFPIVVLNNPGFYSTKNLMGYNLVAVILILTNGAMSVAHWIQIQQHIANSSMVIDPTTLSYHQMKGFSGILQLLTGVSYLIETIVFLLWNFS